MRPAQLVLALFSVALLALLATFADAKRLAHAQANTHTVRVALTERLGLTDLALFCEARYTRHASQADLHSAFQDHPAALEHFPSGSFIQPGHAP